MAEQVAVTAQAPRKLPRRRVILETLTPIVVLVAGILISWYFYTSNTAALSAQANARFSNEEKRGLTEITTRMTSYADLLHSAHGLLVTNPGINQVQWAEYVTSLNLPQRYPGLVGLGFVAYVPSSNLQTFTAATRADNAPNFNVRPAGTRDDYFVVKFVEPLDKNFATLGLDLGADPAQRKAAQDAMDSSMATLTPKLNLPQDPTAESGLIMLVPVYQSEMLGSGDPSQWTLSERQQDLLGWVYGALHSQDVFQGLFPAGQTDLGFEVFDSNNTDIGNLLWASDVGNSNNPNPAITDRQQLSVVGRDWSVGVRTLSTFDTAQSGVGTLGILGVGSVLSLLVALLLVSFINTGRNATALADRMTMALRESEERFRLITENAADLIAVVDDKNRRLYNSPSYKTVLGYTPDELRRTSSLEQVHPDDRALVEQVARESLSTGTGRTIEYRMRHKDGTYRILESIGTVIRDPRGQPEELVVVARDITARKSAEESLHRQNEYLNALQSITLALVSHLNLESLLNDLVARAAQLVSVEHGYITLLDPDGNGMTTRVGVGVFAEHVGDHIKPGQDLAGQVWQSGNPLTVDDYQKLPTRLPGENLDLLHALAAFPLKSGDRTVGVIGVAQEQVGRTFTDDELAALNQFSQLASVALDNARLYDQLEVAVQERTIELRQSEERYRTILENIEDGYYELDLQGNLTFFNDSLSRIFGYSREELLGMNYSQYTDEETGKRLYEAFNQVYTTGEAARNLEYDILRTRQAIRSVGVSVSLVRDRDGKASGFRGVVRDVTPQHRAAKLQTAAYNISQQALTAPSLDDFYKGIHDVVGEFAYARNFYIAFYDEKKQTLNFPYFVDERDALISAADRVVRIGRGVTAYVIRQGKTFHATTAEIEDLAKQGEIDPIGTIPVEWLGVPLKRGDEVFGVVVTQSYDPAHLFTAENRDDLTNLAEHISNAIERKQAEEALRESEERNRLLVQSSPDPVAIYDTDGNVTELNAAFTEIFGWTKEELLRKQIPFVPEKDAVGTQALLETLYKVGKVPLVDSRRMTKAGQVLDVQLSASLLRGRDGVPIGSIFVLRDVSVRRRAELALQQQANYLGALQETTLALVRRLDVNELLRDIVVRAGELVGTENGYVYLLEADEREMQLRVGTGLYDDLIGSRTHEGVGLAGLVWQSNQPLVLDDYQKWPQRLPGARRDLLRAVVGVPLRSGERTIGVIGLAYTEEQRRFGESEMDVLSRFAQLAAVALDNAQLYAESESLYRATAELNLAKTYDDVVHILKQDTLLGQNSQNVNISYFDRPWVNGQKPEWVDVLARSTTIPAELFTPRYPIESFPSIDALININGPSVIEDTENDPRMDDNARALFAGLFRAKSTVFAPLVVGGLWIGFLNAHYPQPTTFSGAAIRRLRTLSSQAAVVIQNLHQNAENERLLQETQQRVHELQLLNTVSQTLTGQLDLQNLVRLVGNEILKTFGMADGYIALYNDKTNRIDFPYNVENGVLVEHSGLEMGQGVTSHIFKTGQPLLLNHDSERRAAELGAMHWAPTQSYLGVPIIYGDRTIGVINIQSEREGLFGDADVRLLSTIAATAGVAIQNARLFAQTQERAREMSALHDAARAMGERLEPEQLFETVYRQVQRLMPLDAFFIATQNEKSSLFTYQFEMDEGQRYTDLTPREPSNRTRSALEGGEPILNCRTPQEMERIYAEGGQGLGSGKVCVSALYIPIKLGSRALGVMSIQSYEFNAYDAHHAELASNLANGLAVALENARLFTDLQQQREHLALANEAANLLTAQVTMEGVLQQALSIAPRLGAQYSYILALEGPDQSLFKSTIPGYENLTESRARKLGETIRMQGLERWVLELKQPALVTDSRTDARWYTAPQHVEEEPARAVVAVPLFGAGGEVSGVLAYTHSTPGHFDEEDVKLVELIGRSAANALDTARLLEKTQHNAQQFATLSEVATEVSGPRFDTNELLDLITRRAMNLVATDGAGVWLPISEDEIELKLTYNVEGPQLAGRRLKKGEGMSGKVFENGQLIRIDDYLKWSGHSETFADAPFHASLAVPMLWQGRTVGVMALTHSQPGRGFSTDDEHIAQLFATQAASALESARLYQETQTRAQELAVVNELAREISQQLSFEQLSETVITRMQGLMKSDSGYIAVYDEANDLMRYPIIYDMGKRYADPNFAVQPTEGSAARRLLDTRDTIVIHRSPEEVAEQNKPENIGNIQGAMGSGYVTASRIYAPLRLGNKITGMLSTQSYAPYAYGAHEIALLNSIASHVAIALENTRLYQETQSALSESQRANQYFVALQDTALGLVSRLDVNELLRDIVTRAGDLVGTHNGYVYLVEANEAEMEMRVGTGLYDDLIGSRARPGAGLAGIVWQSGESFALEDYQKWDQRLPGARRDLLRAVVGVPLKTGDRTIGVIGLAYTDEGRKFGPTELQVLTRFASLASIALDNARLYQETQISLAETAKLYEASSHLAAAQTLQDSITAVAEETFAPTLNRAALLTIERDQEGNPQAAIVSANWHNGQGVPPSPVGRRYPFEQFPVFRLALSPAPIFVDDVPTDPRTDPATVQVAIAQKIRAMIVLPLIVGDRHIGALLIQGEEPHPFTEREKRPYISLSQQLAVAIENRELFEVTQRRVNELAILNRLSQALTSQLDVRGVSQLVVEQLQQIFPESNAYVVSLYDKATNTIQIPYSVEGQEIQTVAPFPLGQGLASHIIQTRAPLLINRDSAKRTEELGAITVGQPAKSYLGVAIQVGDQVIGTISIQSMEREGLFSENEVRLLSTISATVGVALRNAQLFEETRRAQSFLDSVVENMPNMIWVKDAKDLRYVSINKSFEDILGIPRTELLGKNAFDMFRPDEAERFESQDRDVMKSMQLLDVPEETVVSRTHGNRIIHTQKIPIFGTGSEPIYLLAIAEDITERKRIEEERAAFERKLLETQKLESLGVLAGGIAHDFNNLLVSILGNVGLALLDLDPSSPAREPVEQIKVAAQRAADLTKQMLAYSGKGRFVMQRISVNAIIEEMTQLLKVSISKSAVLRLHLTTGVPLIEADATQIRQIVMNLIVNASDAIGTKDGVITLSTGVVSADRTYLSDMFMAPELGEGQYVYLEVADSGVGMDAETQKKIFEPFFTTKFTGRGLGLAAVLGIVRGHKGAIKVYSEPGRGTTFRILLPSLEGTSHMDEGHKTGIIERGSGTVLVIDDEDVVRSVTKRMLERFGYSVMMAPDGREGIEIYKANRDKVSLVLLDMTMPHMSGEETFRELRQFNADTVVLLMSGYTEQEATSRFAGKGLAGFLQKPYTPQELHEKIQAILTGKE